jgi:hypothetical protein
MITITDEASFEAAIANTTDEALRRMLSVRLRLYRAGCLLDLTMLVVLEPGDTSADVERETGLNPLVNPIDEARYGSPSFQQYADWIACDAGYYEWLTCVGNEGWATILLVPDRPGIDPELLSLCRRYAGEGTGRG